MRSRSQDWSAQEFESLLPFLTTEAEKDEVWRELKKLYTKQKVKDKILYYLALRLHISLADDDATMALKWFSWFTTLRLFLVRIGREYNVFHHTYSSSLYGYNNILQFSYFLELFPCIAQAYNNPSLLYNNDWQSTFTNALIWLIVNGCSLSLGTGYAWVNLFGFAFDIWHDWHYTNEEIENLKKLLNKQNWRDDEKEAMWAKIKELKYKRIRVTFVAIGIFIGMALIYLNPLVSAWVPIVGASLVILFGGIIGNLGNRLFQWDKLLINVFDDFSFKKLWSHKAEIIKSIGKLFKEFIKLLSPTLYNGLENFKEDRITAIACIVFAALPLLAFMGACFYFSTLFCLASAHLLLTSGVIFAATELCARLGAYCFSKPESADNIDSIMSKLGDPENNRNLNAYFNAFCRLTPREFETFAKRAELSVIKLVDYIHYWDKILEHPEVASTKRFSTSRYSFLSFKNRILAKQSKLEQNSNESRNLKIVVEATDHDLTRTPSPPTSPMSPKKISSISISSRFTPTPRTPERSSSADSFTSADPPAASRSFSDPLPGPSRKNDLQQRKLFLPHSSLISINNGNKKEKNKEKENWKDVYQQNLITNCKSSQFSTYSSQPQDVSPQPLQQPKSLCVIL